MTSQAIHTIFILHNLIPLIGINIIVKTPPHGSLPLGLLFYIKRLV